MFDPPTARQQLETGLSVAAFDHHQTNAKLALQPSAERVGIGTIRSDHLHVVLPVGRQSGEPLLCPNAVGKSGRMGNYLRQIPHRIRQEVAFPSIHFLAAVVTAFAPAFGGFGTLTVDDPPLGWGRRPQAWRCK